MKIVVAGASGFLGRALVESLRGHEIVALVRHGESIGSAKPVVWNGLKMDRWADVIDGADAVVNYAGSPLSNRWDGEEGKLMKETRVQTTYLIGQAIEGAARPPKVWINASSVGIYGSRGAEMLDEASALGAGQLADLCRVWEDALMQESLPKTRRVALRSGIVLGRDGGALKAMTKLAKMFLGGAQGDGNAWMSWIHMDDHTAMVKWIIESEIAGPVNACAPSPCLNSTFMQTLRGVCGRPVGISAPSFLGRMAGPDPLATIGSVRACPKVAQREGFRWKYPALESTLRDLLYKGSEASIRDRVSVR